MFTAVNSENKKVSIDEVFDGADYFCEICGEKLVIKNHGTYKAHHFAHPKNSLCCDDWNYDMSEWHRHWQSLFPIYMREVVKEFEGKKHRADILIESLNCVLEFQHSNISLEEFTDRNNFYNALGYKVIWVFDFVELFNKGSIRRYRRTANFYWNRPKTNFKNYSVSDKVILFFQLRTDASNNEKLQEITDEANEYGYDRLYYQSREFLDDHENDKVSLYKVIDSEDNLGSFKVSPRIYGVGDFLKMFHIELPAQEGRTSYKSIFTKNDVYDKLQYLYEEDHSYYFYGCPLSKTGKCVSSTIDVPESKYDEIRPCSICPFAKRDDCDQYYCNHKFKSLELKDDDIITDIKKNDREIITELSIVQNNKKRTFSYLSPETICELWKEDTSVVIAKNIRNGNFVKLIRDPNRDLEKYGRCYGYFSRNQFHFGKESGEIYYANRAEWICVWSK